MTGSTTLPLEEILRRAVVDATAWPDVCSEVANFLGGIGAILTPVDMRERGPGLVHSPSIADVYSVYLRDNWATRDPRNAGVAIMQRNGFVTDAEFIDRETFDRHTFYTDFLRQFDIGSSLNILIPMPEQAWIAAVQLPRNSIKRPPEIQSRALEARRLLLAAARTSRAVGVSRLSEWTQFYRAGDHGVFFLDRTGRIIEADGRGEQMLRRFSLSADKGIQLPDATLNRALADLLASASRSELLGPLPPPVLLPVDGRQTIVFEAVPVPASLRHFHARLAALLIVRLASITMANKSQILSARFGLTPSEIRVALGISKGRSPQEIADDHSIAVGTVRQQLKSVYRKIGARSQLHLSAIVNELS